MKRFCLFLLVVCTCRAPAPKFVPPASLPSIKQEPQFEIVEEVLATNAPKASEVSFSPNGQRVAYEVQDPNALGQEHIIAGGVVGPEFDQIVSHITSKDGKVFAYTALKGGQYFLVNNGEIRGPFENAYFTYGGISAHGETVACIIMKNGVYYLDINGKLSDPFEKIYDVRVSSDGSMITYSVKKDNKSFVISDGKKGPEFDSIRYISFSKNNKTISYIGTTDKKDFVITNNKVDPYFGSVRFLWISENGKSVGYQVMKDREQFFVFNGKPDPSVYQMGGVDISKDGKTYSYDMTITGSEHFIVINGKKFGPYDSAANYTDANIDDTIKYIFTKDKKDYIAIGNNQLGPFDNSYSSNHIISSVAYTFQKEKSSYININKKTIGPYDNIILGKTTDDKKFFAAIIRKNETSSLLINEMPIDNSLGVSKVHFISSDGKIVVYEKHDYKKNTVSISVLNNSGEEFDSITEPVIAKDGNIIIYSARKKDKFYLIRNSEKSEIPGMASNIALDHDGKITSYVMRINNRYCVVSNTGETDYFDSIQPTIQNGYYLKKPIFPIYIAKNKELKYSIVVDDRKGSSFERIYTKLFINNKFIYIGIRANNYILVIEGQEFKFDAINNFTTSSDRKHFAYVGLKNKKYYIYVDGTKPIYEVTNLQDLKINNVGIFACVDRVENESFVVSNGIPQIKYDYISDLSLNESGKVSYIGHRKDYLDIISEDLAVQLKNIEYISGSHFLKTIVYKDLVDKKTYLVYNGKKSEPIDNLISYCISDNGLFFAYIAQLGNKKYLYANGTKEEISGDANNIKISNNGNSITYVSTENSIENLVSLRKNKVSYISENLSHVEVFFISPKGDSITALAYNESVPLILQNATGQPILGDIIELRVNQSGTATAYIAQDSSGKQFVVSRDYNGAPADEILNLQLREDGSISYVARRGSQLVRISRSLPSSSTSASDDFVWVPPPSPPFR